MIVILIKYHSVISQLNPQLFPAGVTGIYTAMGQNEHSCSLQFYAREVNKIFASNGRADSHPLRMDFNSGEL